MTSVGSQSPVGSAQRTAGEQAGFSRFLVVDDNEDLVAALGTLLRLGGAEVRVAHDGEAALAAVGAFDPEVVLLDLGIPKLSGCEACRRIRSMPGGASRLIVALTGWGEAEDRACSEAAGFDGHIVKPVRHAALLSLLAELASRRRTAGEGG